MALFRYGVIAEMVCRPLAPGELSQLVRQAAGRRWQLPSGTERQYRERVIWTWIARYRKAGLRGLLPRRRRDAGVFRRLSADALEFACALRREDRARSAALILDMLERSARVLPGSVSRQVIDRALRGAGLERIRPSKHGKTGRVRRRIEVDGPNALWVGDYHDPVEFPVHGGGALRSFLGGWIDHFSRYLPYAAFYRSQALCTLEDTLKNALLRAGKPVKAYVDNAKIYHANAFAFACDRLDIQLVHSKAYDSACRGVIERFWGDGDVAEFEREIAKRGVSGLDELNVLFWAWLEERYHRRPHSETGATPLARRESFQPAFPEINLLAELFLVRVRRKVHRRLSTVEVDGVAFHVDPRLRGKLVQVHYDPHDLSSVVIHFDGRRLERASRALPNVAPPTPQSEQPIPTGFDYLGQVLIDHERRRARQTRPIAFRNLQPGPVFDLAALEHHLEVARARPLKPADRAAVRVFFERYAPLNEDIVSYALERAQAVRGRGLHLSVYLDFVRSFHLDKGGTS
jgi:transposase InsO family protein